MPETQAMLNKREYLESGKTIPICANFGCTKNVTVRDWKYYSFKTFCSRCSNAMQKNWDHPQFEEIGGVVENVKFIKKRYCENRDSRLGFVCPIREEFNFISGILHSDHKNGDHENNDPSNVQTLCNICHYIKGAESGDYDSSVRGRKLS